MGRLTLNILLSFAQFEREVIGERIRDKFAASRTAFNPETRKGGYPSPQTVTFVTGAKSDFSKWRRQRQSPGLLFRKVAAFSVALGFSQEHLGVRVKYRDGSLVD
jgi:hypothetical protein